MAERLGVSTRQVRHLVASGDLRLLARGVVDEASVDRLVAVRGGSHRRAWAEETAWGAVALLSDVDPAWLGTSQRSRLKGRLRAMSFEQLVERARDRADVQRYAAHPSSVLRLRAEMVDLSGATARLGLAGGGGVDGYVATDHLEDLVGHHALVFDDLGSVTLRATTMDLEVVASLAEGSVLAGLDLAESLDVRERRAGLDALDEALARFRGEGSTLDLYRELE